MKIVRALAALSLAGWAALLAGFGGGDIGIVFCAPANAWPTTSALRLVAFVSPANLAASWALMVAAMMPPLIAPPLLYIGERSFTRRRRRSMMLFGAGYGSVWFAVGMVLQPLALALSLLPFGGGAAALAALLWQASPVKQVCLNGCHRQPALIAFGAAADFDALGFGVSHALWCVGACWPLMLMILSAGAGHGAAMLVAALFALAERFEPPGPFVWRPRLPTRLVRIALVRAAESGSDLLSWSSLVMSIPWHVRAALFTRKSAEGTK